MTAIELKAITDEVLRRLAIRTSSHRALLVLNHAPEASGLRDYLEELHAADYSFTQCLRVDEAQCPWLRTVHLTRQWEGLESRAAERLVAEHHLLVVAGLSITQLTELRQLRMKDRLLELICRALRQGKEVRIFSEWADLSASQGGFASKMNRMLLELEALGIRFGAAPQVRGVTVDKAVITKQDLKNVLEGPLVIGSKATLTATAKELLRERKIDVLRR